MSIKTNDLQIIYNEFSTFLFNNLKILRKDIKKDIKKQLKQIGKEYFLKNLNKYIHDIIDEIIIDSARKKKVKKDININNTNIPNGYRMCNKERTKNRGLCKKLCKIDDDGCIFHKGKIITQNDNPNVLGVKSIVDNLDSKFKIENDEKNKIPDGFSLEINKNKYKNNKKINRKKIYIPKDKYMEFPTIQQTQTPGQCFKKNNRLYTINYYNKEVIADVPAGIICHNCGIKRYTKTGPCVNYNCKNNEKSLQPQFYENNKTISKWKF